MEMCLVLSHGQATVERGFSVNADMLLPNMLQSSLVSRRLVYDTLSSMNLEVSEFEVTDDLLQHCK